MDRERLELIIAAINRAKAAAEEASQALDNLAAAAGSLADKGADV